MNTLTLLVLLFATMAMCVGHQKNTMTFVYHPKTAGGVKGFIRVRYLYRHSKYVGAVIVANLDVKHAQGDALHKSDAKCVGPIKQFKWHIHTKWENPTSSGSLSACSLAKTSNHYDPDYACGPASEHVTEAKCKALTPHYKCTPHTYKANPKACEKGDLSGKLGDFHVKKGKIRGKWYDPHFPKPSEVTPSWNIILHAVCGADTPRFVCAKAVK
ncbi:hypothetical protein H257_02982 [Aphanomyces astaci]|uniref:Superoxide dismutase copper/zinc binding domain-containing protein n=1 Tax=Aphanomyces astaci TaxID=112090 RepID=W4H0P3_APHAT|nr:hypothetical protein H257_02982 [Aphanomyces astaci]ETV85136.1 hypothetical protein H257_02982 [Aphanomyces astaci]|eukprot:XP_009825154.1 hypothetical protein H257_02982 [Aphanomyces astaci]